MVIGSEIPVAEDALDLLLHPQVLAGDAGDMVQNVFGVLLTLFICVLQTGSNRYQYKHVLAAFGGRLGVGF